MAPRMGRTQHTGRQAKPMKLLRTLGKQAFATLLCLSLAVWSVMPVSGHTPTVLETVQDHLKMIADHGHSHGFQEDLYWAMHGHGHDAADHDHSQAFVTPGDRTHLASAQSDAWLLRALPGGPRRSFRIERPPRA